jgi:hypothetical protein
MDIERDVQVWVFLFGVLFCLQRQVMAASFRADEKVADIF